MGNFLVNMINKIIQAIGLIITEAINLLPTSPFVMSQSVESEWVNAISWVFPLGTVISHLEAFTVAVGVFYLIRVVLRWLKVAEG